MVKPRDRAGSVPFVPLSPEAPRVRTDSAMQRTVTR
jgi:hypothetical protein